MQNSYRKIAGSISFCQTSATDLCSLQKLQRANTPRHLVPLLTVPSPLQNSIRSTSSPNAPFRSFFNESNPKVPHPPTPLKMDLRGDFSPSTSTPSDTSLPSDAWSCFPNRKLFTTMPDQFARPKVSYTVFRFLFEY